MMTTSGVSSSGKSGYVRHRDIKLSEKELKKERAVLQKTLEGVCATCRGKLSWRFQYDKYKSLTKVAKCQNCKRKCITKAYRTFCDPCSVEKGVCPGCCSSILITSRKFSKFETRMDDEG